MPNTQIGVISCSGEECLGGTLARMATRKVMEKLRIGRVVSLCLPLYIAGGDEERDFANKFPVIAVDGCAKCCAKRATIKYSGAVKADVVISEIVGEDIALSKVVSARDLTDEHYKMADQVAKAICKNVDEIVEE